MALGARNRWLIYGAAAVATLLAMRWADGLGAQPAPAVSQPLRRHADGPAQLDAAAAGAPPLRIEPLRQRTPLPPGTDPFGSVAAEPTPEVRVSSATPAAPVRSQAPPLPYAYVGRWTEAGKTVVFLSEQEHNIPVRGPGKLSESYAVRSIDDKQMVLVYLPSNTVQVLPLTKAEGGAAMAAASPAAAPAAETEQGN
jgi:hypothetical protein